MANYTAADVKRLRELTGAGMMASKNALVEADGDFVYSLAGAPVSEVPVPAAAWLLGGVMPGV